MGSSYQKYLSLSGINSANLSLEELQALVKQTLDQKIHGLSFSPYVEGQGPGTVLGEEQIRERLSLIQANTKWIRTFSCTEGNELIPKIAHDVGLKTMVGVWLGEDLEKNQEEIANAIEVAKAGYANILGVGNEVLLRGDVSEDQLIDYINRVKQAVPDVEVGYVDAYFKFVDYPRVTEACDVILANCYPFWEGCPAEHSLLYMKDMYQRAMKAGNGKRVIITETGWPNVGSAERGAIPSYENAIKYFINAYQWAEEDDIDIFYFSSFDETWKVADEGDVGAYWGLWDKDGKLKYA
jgi:exo-beta-1,3-glucanase (GH17 family)